MTKSALTMQGIMIDVIEEIAARHIYVQSVQ